MDTTTLDTTTLNGQTDLNSVLQNSSGSLIPESYIQSFMTMLAISTIISCVILGLFLVMYIISAIRKWKVQSAILHMQKDVSDIKQHLIGGNTQSGTNGVDEGIIPSVDTTPSSSSPLIAVDR